MAELSARARHVIELMGGGEPAGCLLGPRGTYRREGDYWFLLALPGIGLGTVAELVKSGLVEVRPNRVNTEWSMGDGCYYRLVPDLGDLWVE